MSVNNPQLSKMLAIMRQQPGNAELALFLGARLEEAGNAEQAVALWSLGDDVGGFVRNVRNDSRATKEMQADSKLANGKICERLTKLHDQSIDDFERHSGERVPRIRRGIWCLTNNEEFEFADPLQKPVIFYVPELSVQPVWDGSQLEKLSPLVDGFSQVASEYSVAAEKLNLTEPYVPRSTPGREWLKLRGTLDWSALYLFKDSKPTENTQLFPETVKLFEQLDIVRVNQNPMEIFFSRLTPGAHIPPHFGLTNSRLTVHLPLTVPNNCAIRVKDREHCWTPGEPFAFDDSFEHEAWNRSEEDRVVLIFEIHHPALSPSECNAIEYCYAARDRWLNNRRKILGWD